MIPDETVRSALAAADQPVMLTSGAEVARAAKAWRRSRVLALDTEFVRERTYFANLGLVQISDAQTVWLLDPLADGTIAPLAELLADPRVAKLLHSPSEDLEVLQHVTGELPDPLIDSQLACAMLGQPLQLGYHHAAEWLLGVTVEKELTRSNWCARPLRQELLRYAGLDVCLLPLMWTLLKERLQEAGRLDWLQEDCARLLDEARTTARPEDAWQRIRGTGRLDGASLAILQSLSAWREAEARQRNRPRGFIVTDAVLIRIASERMRNLRDLEDLEGLHPRARQRYGKAITARVAEVLDQGVKLPELPRLDPAQRRELKRLRAEVARVAGELGVEPVLLASRRELEELVHGDGQPPWPGRLPGWRAELLEPVLSRAGQDSVQE